MEIKAMLSLAIYRTLGAIWDEHGLFRLLWTSGTDTEQLSLVY